MHGYTDYFFNTELAEHFAARGWRFYGIDLHRCGRSWREGQTPHFTTDLTRYDRELEWAWRSSPRRTRGPGTWCTGTRPAVWWCRCGWTGCAAAGDTAATGIAGLVLNSPFLDLQRSGDPADPGDRRRRSGRYRGFARPAWCGGPVSGGYGLTLHRDYHGEFDYNLRWKPVGGFPITSGGFTPSDAAQARLHRGLDVGVPNLVLRSDHSVAETAETRGSMQRGDAVLDVDHIARWAGCIGNRQTSRAGGRRQARRVFVTGRTAPAAYAELDSWLEQL